MVILVLYAASKGKVLNRTFDGKNGLPKIIVIIKPHRPNASLTNREFLYAK